MNIEDEGGQNPPSAPASAPETENDDAVTTEEEHGGNEPTSLLDALTEELGGEDGDADGEPVSRETADDDAADESEEHGDDEPETEEAGEGAQEEAAVTDEDDLYAPLPEDVKEKTRERFNKLVESHKALSSQLETMREENDGFREVIRYSQATPEEFNQLVEYSRLVKSGDLGNLKAALRILDEQRAGIARLLNEPVAGVDQLADFPDLRQRVETAELSEQDAIEIAALRRREAAIRSQQQAAAQEQQQAASLQQQVAAAQQEIVALASQWQANDIDYPKKHERLMAKAQEIAATYPPHLWKQALTDYYDAMQVASPPPSAPPQENSPQPLRPQSGGGGKPVPQSMLQAVEQALGD